MLYSFCAEGGARCTDGSGPGAGLIMDKKGHLYGTTFSGGAHGSGSRGGTVFELVPNTAGTQWTETVLYSFCAQGGTSCTDGSGPDGLIMDATGHLYGTTELGGTQNAHCNFFGEGCGVVFELTPNAARIRWTETVLHSFCAQGGGCTDGHTPIAALIMDGAGRLYGTTYAGGADGGGTVFELTPNAARTLWTETVLYSFCAKHQGKICTDGRLPAAPLIIDRARNLYGTTYQGGNETDSGAVFKLTPNAARTQWTETVLYSFCSRSFCVDGVFPAAPVTMDAAGYLYGTTELGGTEIDSGGTVFELTANAAGTQWTERVLYSFGAQHDDGKNPVAGVIMDAGGHLYGTTWYGGASRSGTVFELSPNAARPRWTESVLYSFCTRGGCTDGASAVAPLIMDAAGHLYGTTELGGAHYYCSKVTDFCYGGTVFELP